MALSKPEQMIKITLLLRDIPEELEMHFCSTKPACMRFCSVDGETRDKSKCQLLVATEDDVKATIFGLDSVGRLMGIIPDE